jgi:hypothetical protein
MKWLLRLYPPAWRARYGAEMAELLDELPSGPGIAIDLVRGAGQAHLQAATDRMASSLQTAGGPPMTTQPLQRHPTALAILALVLAAPTILMVAASFLAYQVGLPALAATIEPLMKALDDLPRIVDLWLLGAPFLAFLIAAAPLFGASLGRVDGELRLTLAFRPRLLNVVIALVALGVGGMLVAHIVAEFVLEAP